MFFCFRLKSNNNDGEEAGGGGDIADLNLFFSKKRCSVSSKNPLSFVRLNFSDPCITMNGLYLDVSDELPSNAGFRALQERVARLYKLEFACPAKSVRYIDHFQRRGEGGEEFSRLCAADADVDVDADADEDADADADEDANEGADKDAKATVLRIDGVWENDTHLGFSHKFYYNCRHTS